MKLNINGENYDLRECQLFILYRYTMLELDVKIPWELLQEINNFRMWKANIQSSKRLKSKKLIRLTFFKLLVEVEVLKMNVNLTIYKTAKK